MKEPRFLPGEELDNLQDAFEECRLSWNSQEGDEEVLIDSVLSLFKNYCSPNVLDVLFNRIKHGDEAHQQWLRAEMEKWFSILDPVKG